MTGTIIQVNVSRGGVPKHPVPEAYLTPLGLEGDSVAHPKFHGGPRQAVLIVCSEAIDELVGKGFSVFQGAMGENLTTLGLDRHLMRVGQRFQAGEAILEITKLRVPCDTLTIYGSGIQAEVYDARVKAGDPTSPRWGLAGFYCSVARTGLIRQNDPIRLLNQSA